jgi:hypothetical protein
MAAEAGHASSSRLSAVGRQGLLASGRSLGARSRRRIVIEDGQEPESGGNTLRRPSACRAHGSAAVRLLSPVHKLHPMSLALPRETLSLGDFQRYPERKKAMTWFPLVKRLALLPTKRCGTPQKQSVLPEADCCARRPRYTLRPDTPAPRKRASPKPSHKKTWLTLRLGYSRRMCFIPLFRVETPAASAPVGV